MNFGIEKGAAGATPLFREKVSLLSPEDVSAVVRRTRLPVRPRTFFHPAHLIENSDLHPADTVFAFAFSASAVVGPGVRAHPGTRWLCQLVGLCTGYPVPEVHQAIVANVPGILAELRGLLGGEYCATNRQGRGSGLNLDKKRCAGGGKKRDHHSSQCENNAVHGVAPL